MSYIERVFFDEMSGLVHPTCALGKLGLCSNYWGLDLMSPQGVTTISGSVRWKSTKVKELDRTNYIEKCDYPYIDVPIVERALIDCIRMIDEVDEGLMVEAFGNYQEYEDYDLQKLYEVADFYNVPRDTVDYWLREGYDWVNGGQKH